MKIKQLLDINDIKNSDKCLILSEILKLSIPEIKINKEYELTKEEYKLYKKISKKVKNNVPVQYALKKANFYGLDFYVDKSVLIPRPETEYLVNKTLKLINNNFNNNNIKILDIGTGSGVIGITLKKELKNCEITATDISKKAIKVAKKNAKMNNVKINYVRTNLYKGINDKFDVIISNPPYIDKNSNIEKIVKDNEPHLALFAKEEGLYFYKRILENIKNIINEEFIIAFEIGENQGEKLIQIVKGYFPKEEIILEKDYNDIDRYLFIQPKK